MTFGYGGEWTPNERTTLSAFRDKRFFGHGHRVAFNHRSPLSSWRFLDTRDEYLFPGQTGQGGQAGESNFGTYHALLSKQSGDSLHAEIAQTDRLLKAVDPARSALFRFPYGAHNKEGLDHLAVVP